MATTVTKVIDPDMGTGYDYDSLYDWEAAQQGDLTGARDEIAVAKCRCTGGTADTTEVSIDGWTISTTQFVKIWTDTAESYRHSGKWETGNKYRLIPNVDEAFALDINESYTQIIGLMVGLTSNGSRTSYLKGIRFRNAVTGIVSQCIVKGKTGIDNSVGIHVLYDTNTGPFYVVNNIVFDIPGTGSYGILTENGTTNQAAFIYNNTVVDCTSGIGNSRYQQQTLKNNIVKGATSSPFYGDWLLASNNATNVADSQIAAATETGTRESQTFTFVNEATDDFHLASNDAGALGYGLNLYNDADYPFQTDIDGQDRGGAAATWDIGADEYVSSTAIEQKNFRFRNDDDSEPAATWKANQDTNITLAADTAFRLRFLLKATGNPDSIDAQAEARVKPSGGAFGAWGKIN